MYVKLIEATPEAFVVEATLLGAEVGVGVGVAVAEPGTGEGVGVAVGAPGTLVGVGVAVAAGGGATQRWLLLQTRPLLQSFLLPGFRHSTHFFWTQYCVPPRQSLLPLQAA